MGRKLQISIVAVVATMVLGALLVYWVDSRYDDQIADGVRIGSIDVGGLDRADAATQIRASLITPLQKNVVVKSGGEKFKLRPDLKHKAEAVSGLCGYLAHWRVSWPCLSVE